MLAPKFGACPLRMRCYQRILGHLARAVDRGSAIQGAIQAAFDRAGDDAVPLGVAFLVAALRMPDASRVLNTVPRWTCYKCGLVIVNDTLFLVCPRGSVPIPTINRCGVAVLSVDGRVMPSESLAGFLQLSVFLRSAGDSMKVRKWIALVTRPR